jgi:hypothetical protein
MQRAWMDATCDLATADALDCLRVSLRSLSRSPTVLWMRNGSRSESKGRRHSQMSERWAGDTAGWSTQARLARLKVRVG